MRPARVATKIAKGFGLTIGTIIGLVVLVVLGVLYVPPLSQLVIERAVAWYDGRVPGSIAIGDVSGSIGGRLRLENVLVADGEGNPLVEAGALELDVNPWALVRGDLTVDELLVQSTTVHAWEDAPGWADLSPPEKKPKPDKGPGLDLPLGINAEAHIEGFAFIKHSAAGDQTLVEDVALSAEVEGEGTRLQATLSGGAASLPAYGLDVESLSANLSWDDTLITATDLEVATNQGAVQDLDAAFDIVTQQGDANLVAEVYAKTLQDRLGLELENDAQIRLGVHGGADLANVTADIAAGEDTRARVTALASYRDSEVALSGFAGASVPPRFIGLQGSRPLALEVLLNADGSFDDKVDFATLAHCTTCPGGLTVDANGSYRAARESEGAELDFAVDVSAPQTRIESNGTLRLTAPAPGKDNRTASQTQARAQMQAQGPPDVPELTLAERIKDFKATIDTDDLQAALRPVSPWITIPPAKGAFEGVIGCRGGDCTVDLRGRGVAYEANRVGELAIDGSVDIAGKTPRFDVEIGATDLELPGQQLAALTVKASGTPKVIDLEVGAKGRRAGERARVVGTIRIGEPLEIALREMDVRLRGLRAVLRAPTTISIGPRGIEVDGLDMRVAEGTLRASGLINRKGVSDFELVIANFELGELRPLLPALGLGGEVDLVAKVRGTPERPEIALDGRITSLVYAKERIGDLYLDVGFDEGTLSTDVALNRGLARAAVVRAELPLDLDLGTFAAKLRRAEPLDARVDVRALRLERLQAFQALDLEGLLDFELVASGTTDVPVVVASLKGFHLQIASFEIGNAHTRFAYLRKRAYLNAKVVGGYVKGIELAAAVPVGLSLAPFAFDWRKADEHRLALLVDKLDIGDAGEAFGLDSVDGVISVNSVIDGRAADLESHLKLVASDLTVADEPVGEARIEGRLANNTIDMRLKVEGPAAGLLEARAEIPFTLSLDPMEVGLQPTKAHTVRLVARDVHLQPFGRMAQLGHVEGSMNGEITLVGTLHRPILDTELRFARLSYQDGRIGDASIRAEYRDERFALDVEQRRDTEQHLELHGAMPVGVDLATGSFDWHAEEQHELSLHAVGLDHRLLESFADLPPPLRFNTSVRVAASGNAETFTVDGQIRGRLERPDDIHTPFSGTIAVNSTAQDIRFIFGPHDNHTLVASVVAKAPVGAIVRGETDPGEVPFAARMQSDGFPIETLAPLMPLALHDPSGALTTNILFDGTFSEPNLEGRISLRNGALTVVALNQRLENTKMDVRLENADIFIDELSFRSGQGKARAEGKMHLGKGTTVAHAELTLDELPVVKSGLPLMQVSTKVVTDLDATGEVTAVDIKAHNTLVTVLETKITKSPAPIPSDDSVVYVDEPKGERATEPGQPPEKTPLLPQGMRMTFELVEPIVITGPPVDMSWDGRVMVATSPTGETEVAGALDAQRGTFRLLGNEFELESGRVTMPGHGEVDPYLSIVAATDTPEARVLVTISGRASKPELRLTSEPPMPENDVFALLITGSSDGERADDSTVEAKAASLLAAFQNPVLQRAMQERVGIDRIGVGFGEDVDEPILTVGKRFSRKLYVETQYHHNAPEDQNQAEVRLEYFFHPPNWTFETFFGTAAQGGLGVWWQKRFGRIKEASAKRGEGGKDIADQAPPAKGRRSQRSDRATPK